MQNKRTGRYRGRGDPSPRGDRRRCWMMAVDKRMPGARAKSAERALGILELLSKGRDGLTFTQIVEATGSRRAASTSCCPCSWGAGSSTSTPTACATRWASGCGRAARPFIRQRELVPGSQADPADRRRGAQRDRAPGRPGRSRHRLPRAGRFVTRGPPAIEDRVDHAGPRDGARQGHARRPSGPGAGEAVRASGARASERLERSGPSRTSSRSSIASERSASRSTTRNRSRACAVSRSRSATTAAGLSRRSAHPSRSPGRRRLGSRPR